MEYMIQEETLSNIADAIRYKTGESGGITPENMPAKIYNIIGGDGNTIVRGIISFKDDATSNITILNNTIFMVYSPTTGILYPLGDYTFRFSTSSKVSSFSITIVDSDILWKVSTSSGMNANLGFILFSSSGFNVSPELVNTASSDSGTVKNFTHYSNLSTAYDGMIIYGGSQLGEAEVSS